MRHAADRRDARHAAVGARIPRVQAFALPQWPCRRSELLRQGLSALDAWIRDIRRSDRGGRRAPARLPGEREESARRRRRRRGRRQSPPGFGVGVRYVLGSVPRQPAYRALMQGEPPLLPRLPPEVGPQPARAALLEVPRRHGTAHRVGRARGGPVARRGEGRAGGERGPPSVKGRHRPLGVPLRLRAGQRRAVHHRRRAGAHRRALRRGPLRAHEVGYPRRRVPAEWQADRARRRQPRSR
mmetsp:Transcript_52213/g.137159  ORF Transcript_52213/g.137159 Transcript_52213/m.137159 type:complete len:241 (+) Transcript_52213:130-852(+)